MRISTAEAIVLSFTSWWALRLLAPDDAFHSVPQVYQHMAHVADEWVWAFGVLSVLFVHACSYLFDWLWLRRITLMAIACFWGYLAALFLSTLPHGLVWGTHAITAAIAAWAFAMTYEHGGVHLDAADD